MTETAKLEALIGAELERMNDAGCLTVYETADDRGLTIDEYTDLFAVIYRALSRPAVKALEWVEATGRISGTVAVSVIGDYLIMPLLAEVGVRMKMPHTSGWVRYADPESAKAVAQSDFEHRILSSLSPPTGEMVLVPKSALDWLNGTGPDANGHHFGDAPDDFPMGRTFWWRTKFRALIDAPLPSPPEAV